MAYTSSEWAPSELKALDAAVEAWQARGVAVEAHEALAGEKANMHPHTLPPSKLGQSTAGHLLIDTVQAAPNLPQVFEHEIGHVLGLDHVPAGVMQAVVDPASPAPAWSDADEVECLRAGACL